MTDSKYNLQDVCDALSNLEEAIKCPKKNDFGQSVGDELHQIEWQLSRIADVLEQIVKKIP